MSAPVEVLSIMDRDAQHAAAYRLEHGYADGPLSEPVSEATEARAAVAELIDAGKVYESVMSREKCPRCGGFGSEP